MTSLTSIKKSIFCSEPYEISLNEETFDIYQIVRQIFPWLNNNIGKRGETWEYEWEARNNKRIDVFFFKSKEDAFRFKLLWA